MLLRANALAKGNSGARVETVELLLDCLNRGVVCRTCPRAARSARPAISPRSRTSRCRSSGRARRGSTGSACPAPRRSRALGLEPIVLAAKEGLSLINGTQFMAALGALGLVRARRLAQAADIACALSLEALQGSRTSFLPQIQRLRPLRGQAASAANVMLLLEGSAIIESHRWCDKVQDAYSLRCAPQVHGASRDLLDYVDYTVSVELNAATDNPLVLVEDEVLVSNGNFHGQPVAFALDALAMAVAELASISERRVERLVNPNLSDGLPAFLTTDGGLNSGFMIPQYVAASLVSENKVLCHPASVDSIPTSAGQEDHVSMGNAAGLKAWQVLANCERALAIELLAGAQAVEFLAPLEPGAGVRATRAVRAHALAAPSATTGRSRATSRRSRTRSATARSSPPSRPRWGSCGEVACHWPGPAERPRSKHPYRDAAIVYAGLAVVIVVAAFLDGRQPSARAVITAVVVFVVATAWTWFHLRRAQGEGGSGSERDRDARRAGRGALRRPLGDPRAARDAS